MNLILVGTSRCDVPAREPAGGIVAPLNAARTAQRAVPTNFMGSLDFQNSDAHWHHELAQVVAQPSRLRAWRRLGARTSASGTLGKLAGGTPGATPVHGKGFAGLHGYGLRARA